MDRTICFIVIMLSYTIYKADFWDVPLESEPYITIYEKGSRYFYFPGDGDGKIYFVDSEPIVMRKDSPRIQISYWLYTRRNMNESQRLKIYDVDTVTKSNFDINKNTVFVVHGWKGSCNNTISKLLTSAFLEDGDVNVIVVDYSEDADLFYALAQSASVDVGTYLGEFINWMTTLGMSYETTHLVGYSLGAHIVGIAGRCNNGNVRRITALDPAGPLWYDNVHRIKKTDAKYVEVIHTNMLFYGYDGKLGHADFYPNGGVFMPECSINACSHSVSYYYMAQTVKYNNLIANECKNFNEVSVDSCSGSEYPMGNSDLNKNRTGIFRVDTNVEYLGATFR